MLTTSTQPDSNPPVQQKPLIKLAHRELVAANFQIAPKILEDKVPRGLELDYFKDETYISLVCMLKHIIIWGVPLARPFIEISLRFYVRHPSDPVNRKGTCFLRNYVSSAAGAWLLGSKFDQRYQKLKMKQNNSGFGSDTDIPEADYQWKIDDHWNVLRVKGRSQISKTGPDTKVGFILDHRTHYQSHKGKTLEYQVERPQWTVWDAAHANFTCDTKRLFGNEFVHALQQRPASVFISSGSDVSVFRPTVVE